MLLGLNGVSCAAVAVGDGGGPGGTGFWNGKSWTLVTAS
jgi:hypothetical protein